MALREKIYVEILTPHPLTSPEEGERVLRLWHSYLPSCLPEKVGNWEPVDQAFDLDERDAILRLWRWPFLAVKSKPRMDAEVFMRKGELLQHATWKLCFDYGDVDVRELTRFLQVASKMLEGDFGCLTLLTHAEIEAGRKNGAVSALDRRATRFNFLISSRDIRKCIPDVYWMPVFGAPYVKMFGRDRLLSAPVHKAETLGEAAISLQLTPSLGDVRADASLFAQTKRG